MTNHVLLMRRCWARPGRSSTSADRRRRLHRLPRTTRTRTPDQDPADPPPRRGRAGARSRICWSPSSPPGKQNKIEELKKVDEVRGEG